MKDWLVFADLHVTAKTLETCRKVLERVHEVALDRGARVAFLGDFWTVRGSMPVGPANELFDLIGQWEVDSLWLPGNHDQVNLGGTVHGLHLLGEYGNGRARVLSAPEVYDGALWVPYRRDVYAFHDAMALDGYTYQAIMCHIDVVGAFVNDSIQAGHGVDPADLPRDMPIYTGHYHMPHVVPDAEHIMYVGSPYQTSLSEAGQDKRLLLLDGETFEIKEQVPIDVGRRYHRLGAGDDASAAAAGDRVVLRSDKTMDEMDAETLAKVAELRARGVEVDFRAAPKALTARIANADDLGMLELWQAYADAAELGPDVRAEGERILSEIDFRSGDVGKFVKVDFVSVQVRGYGPFVEEVTYPMENRGAVLVVGVNADDPGADSNGAGKTTLVMAALWALTGRTDARREGNTFKGLGKEVINEGCKEAYVRLVMRIDDKDVVVERSMTKRSHSLKLTVDGDSDTYTGQDIGLTQKAIDGLVDTSLLRRTVFFGQHDVGGFLDASDKRAKEMLTEVVDVFCWEQMQREVAVRLRAAKGIHKDHEQKGFELNGRLLSSERGVERAKEQQAGWEDGRRNRVERAQRALGTKEKERDDWSQRRDQRRNAAIAKVADVTAQSDEWMRKRDDRIMAVDAKLSHLGETSAAWDRERADRLAELRADVERKESEVSRMTVDEDELRKLRDAVSRPDQEAREFQQAVMDTHAELAAAESAVSIAQSPVERVKRDGARLRAQRDSYASVDPNKTCETCGQKLDPNHRAKILAELDEQLAKLRDEYRGVSADLQEAKRMKTALQSALVKRKQERDEHARKHAEKIAGLRRQLDELDRLKAKVVGAQRGLDRLRFNVRELEGKQNPAEHERKRLEAERSNVVEMRNPWSGAVQAEKERIGAIASETNPVEAAVTAAIAEVERVTAEINPHSERVSQAAAERDTLEAEKASWSKRLQELAIRTELLQVVEKTAGREGVQSFIIEAALADLQGRVHVFLDAMTDGYMTLELAATKDRADGKGALEKLSKVVRMRRRDGTYVERPLKALSGGQGRRLGIAMTLAFAGFVQARTGIQSNVIVLDEVFRHLDAAGMNRVNDIVRQMQYSTVLVISHDAGLSGRFDRADVVTMRNDVATMEVAK